MPELLEKSHLVTATIQISSYVGENKEFERQYLKGELEVELTPQVRATKIMDRLKSCNLNQSRAPWQRG